MSADDKVKISTRDRVLYVTLDSPPVNIMTADIMMRLADAVDRAQNDRELVAVAVKSAAKAFSAGADVGEHHPDKATGMIEAFSRLFDRIQSLELPLVMAVGGAALGAGFELAMTADILVASTKASFGQPEIRLGFFAPLAVAWLPRLVGPAKAAEITATGRSYSAEEMHRMGLVSRVVEPDELEGALESILDDLRKASAVVMRMNMRLLRKLADMPLGEARGEAEKVFLEELMACEDVLEGIASFYEKRKPAWKNR